MTPDSLLVPPEALRFQTKDGGVPSWLAPLERPTWLALSQATHLQAADPVIVVTPNERSYVLPWWVMKNHHVANLELEGEPVTVTLCELCAGSSAYDARMDGELRTFQVVGAWKGTHVVADYQTRSIWSSFHGDCAWGYHQGERLRQLPLFQARWEDCADLPDGSVVADGAGESREGHGASLRPETEALPLSQIPGGIDERLPSNQLVLGVACGSARRAYPLPALRAGGGVLHDTVDGTDIVVAAGASPYTAIAFERRLDGRTLGFTRRNGSLQDEETGSTWALTGHAVDGPLAGERLTYVESHIEKWYSWAAYQPATEIAARP